MMHAAYVAFDVGNECVDPFELVETLFIFHEDRIPMLESLRSDHSVGRPSVGSDFTALLHLGSGHGENFLLADFRNVLHGCESGFVSSTFHAHEHFGFAFGSSSSLAGLLRPNEHVVHLHQTRQLIPDVSISHCLAYLMSHQPGGLVALDGKQPLHPKNGHATLLTRHEQNHPKPLTKGSPRLVKDRSRSHRNLVVAGSALIQMTRGNVTVLFMAAARTRKPFRPSNAKEMLPTRILVGKTILEFKKAHRFLLHRFNLSLNVGGGNITPTEQSQ